MLLLKEKYKEHWKIKDKIPALIYSKFYPAGSSPGRFYGTAKLRKVKDSGTVEDYRLDQLFQTLGHLRTN